MLYVAHAAVKLEGIEPSMDKACWHEIQLSGVKHCRWKYNEKQVCHVVAGEFFDPDAALACAKRLYTGLFYSVLKKGLQVEDAGCSSYEPRILIHEEVSADGYNGDERFFFWNKKLQGGELGPGVFEVDASIDEFDDYNFYGIDFSITQDVDLSLDDVTRYYSPYDRETQVLFNAVLLAEHAPDTGMKMAIYCSLLEHLADNKQKSAAIIRVLDELIDTVKCASLSQKERDSLISFLNSGRMLSSRQKCISLCEKYAEAEYGGIDTKSIVGEAYTIRSTFSHGNMCADKHLAKGKYIKLVVLDVIRRYLLEKECND